MTIYNLPSGQKITIRPQKIRDPFSLEFKLVYVAISSVVAPIARDTELEAYSDMVSIMTGGQ